MVSEKDIDHRESKDKSDIIEYRLDKLEEAVNKLSLLSDVVLRWDARFQQQGGLMQCALHQSRMEEFDRQIKEINKIMIDRTKSVLMVDEHETKLITFQLELENLKAYMNKAIGALVVISIIVQIVGPVMLERLHVNRTSVRASTPTSSIVSDTPGATYFTYSQKTNKIQTQ